MALPTIIGTTKGYFGNLNSYTGLILETEDYDYKNESVDFPDGNSTTVAVAYFNETADVSFKGYVLNGTNWTGTLASTMSLSSMPSYYKSGVVTGTTIVESIKIGNSSKDWRKIDISCRHLPGVV